MSNLEALLRKQSAIVDHEEDFEKINQLFYERGWGDGLPVVPPTVPRVERMLEYCDRPWHEPIAKIAPRYGEATPLRLAANAVMAGCRPEYFPLVMLAIEAMCEESFNLYAVQATTHSCAPLVVVNGPVAQELNIHSGHAAFGPGAWSNATIGRAIRLALINIGGAVPGNGDMATYGSPAKFSYCAAENEAASPWEPLHVERGYAADTSTVTVISAEGPHNVNDHESTNAEGLLKTIAGTVATTGSNNVRNAQSDPVILVGPEHAATIAADGYSKRDVKRYLFEQARIPINRFAAENIERRIAVKIRAESPESGVYIPAARSADDFILVVIGGAGKHSALIPTFGHGRSVTRPLRTNDGLLAKSVQEFRRNSQ